MRDPAGHWWRRLAALWAASLLLVLAGMPAFDALVCSDDFGARAEAATSLETPPADPADGHDPETAGICQHGHCHHGSQAVPSSLSRDYSPAGFVERPVLVPSRIPPSAPAHDLTRPPKT